MAYIHSYYPIFSYFDKTLNHPPWHQLDILDFGGNVGNLLKDPSCTITHEKYTCLDVDPAPLNAGKKLFPKANWVQYNRFNSVYNQMGNIEEAFPQLDQLFDIILAYSVFTHTNQTEMHNTICRELYPLLKSNGCLSFTYLEPDKLKYFIAKRKLSFPEVHEDKLLFEAKELSQFYYINHDEITQKEPALLTTHHHMLAFYSKDYMYNIFEDFQPILSDPIMGELQSCVTLRSKA